MSTFNASASLSALTSSIQVELYPLTSAPQELDDARHQHFVRELNAWFDRLPPELIPDVGEHSQTLPHM